MLIRLQKILSSAGVASRRAAEGLMREGRVTVNGTVVRELGSRADPVQDDIRVDGRRVKPARHRYLLLNKPRGYVSTRSDPQHRPTVMDLLRGIHDYVYPVGRLDYDSEGLLLLTNDGELAARLMHPRYHVKRVYQARLRGVPDRHALERLRRGVTIDGRPTAATTIRLLDRGKRGLASQALVEMTIAEGRKHLVRNMCQAIGHPIIRLRRVRFGPVADDRLPPGAYRELTPEEVRRLRAAVRDPRPTVR